VDDDEMPGVAPEDEGPIDDLDRIDAEVDAIPDEFVAARLVQVLRVAAARRHGDRLDTGQGQ
jgi:hypothetical protein